MRQAFDSPNKQVPFQFLSSKKPTQTSSKKQPTIDENVIPVTQNKPEDGEIEPEMEIHNLFGHTYRKVDLEFMQFYERTKILLSKTLSLCDNDEMAADLFFRFNLNQDTSPHIIEEQPLISIKNPIQVPQMMLLIPPEDDLS